MKKMRVLKSVAAAIALVCLVSGSSNRIVAQQSEPSLNETVEWITTKVNAEGSFPFRGAVGRGTDTEKVVGFSACTLRAELHRENRDPEGLSTLRWDIEYPLKELSPDVKVKRGDGFYYIGVNATARPSINVRIRSTPSYTSPRDETKKVSNYGFGYFNTEDTAQRVAKALSHAITLCGGKKELF